MKQLTCEMCGSTDLLKQDGVFVCQTCGCKYYVEEAKKMMVEGTVDVSGSTIEVDNSELIDSYLQMAEKALDATNNAEAETYANKVIEIDPHSYRAWYIKGKAAGWQTTGENYRFPESITAWINAYNYAPEEKKIEISSKVEEDGSDIALAIITMECNNFVNFCSAEDSEDFCSAEDSEDFCSAEDSEAILDSILGSITSIEEQFQDLKAETKIDIYTTDFKTMCARIVYNGVVDAAAKSVAKFGPNNSNRGDMQWITSSMDLRDILYAMDAMGVASSLLDKAYDLSSDEELCEQICKNYIAIAKELRGSFAEDDSEDDSEDESEDDSFADEEKDYGSQLEEKISQWEEKLDKHNAVKRKENLDKVSSYLNDSREPEEKELAKTQYWEAHSEEKVNLTQELTQLNSNINQIKKMIETDTDRLEVERLDQEIGDLNNQLKSLGIFKRKERREVNAHIKEITKEKKPYQERWDSKKENYDKELKLAEKRKSEIDDEFRKDRVAKIQPTHYLALNTENGNIVNGLDLVEYHKLVMPKGFTIKGDGEKAIEKYYTKTIQIKQYRVRFMNEGSETHIVLDFFGKAVADPIGEQLIYTLEDDKTPLAVSQYIKVISSAILGICPDIDMNEFIKTLEEAAYGFVIEKQFEVNDIICIVTGGSKNDLKCTLRYKHS